MQAREQVIKKVGHAEGVDSNSQVKPETEAQGGSGFFTWQRPECMVPVYDDR